MNSHTGFYSIRELLELTRDLQFFRYFPPDPNGADELKCSLVLRSGASPEEILEHLNDINSRHNNISLYAVFHANERLIDVELQNIGPKFDLEAKTFETAVIVERELLELGKLDQFELSVFRFLQDNGFDPERWKS